MGNEKGRTIATTIVKSPPVMVSKAREQSLWDQLFNLFPEKLRSMNIEHVII